MDKGIAALIGDNWSKCDDVLPEPGLSVLVFRHVDNGEDLQAVAYLGFNSSDLNHFIPDGVRPRHATDKAILDFEPTHWRPLPASPKVLS